MRVAASTTTGRAQPTAPKPKRKRRRAAPPAPTRPVPAAAPARISVAERPFPVDRALVERDARETLAAIDFSRRDIVIWVQGSGNHGMRPDFEAEVRKRWSDAEVALTHLRYPAARNIRPSVGNGVEALRLVLAGIAAQGGGHRVFLAGDSQGAWVLGEAVADPRLRAVVTRAVMMGHPWLAAHHQDEADHQIVEVNKRGDHVATPMRGSADDAVDAYSAIHALLPSLLPAALRNAVRNPWHVMSLARTGLSFLPLIGRFFTNTHAYGDVMASAVAFLQDGDVEALRGAVAATSDVSAGAAAVSGAAQRAA